MASPTTHMPVDEDHGALLSDCLALLRPYIARHVKTDQVDDVLQETLLRLHQRGDENSIDNFRAYAFQTARSVIVDGARRDAARKRTAHRSLEEHHYPVDPITPEQTLIGREAVEQLASALKEMPERTRHIFILQRFEGMSYPAIAEHMEISLSAVGKHMVRALRFLSERDFW